MYVIFILLYFLTGDAFVKMLPCLLLAHNSDSLGLIATFTFAALGDFFFHTPETFFAGIAFFIFMNLSLVKNIHELYGSIGALDPRGGSYAPNYVLVWRVWVQYLSLIFATILQYVFYSVFQNAITLAVINMYVASLLYMLYTTFTHRVREVRVNKFNLSCRYAASLFVISDICILLKFATSINLSPIGLSLYWASMYLFNYTLKTNLCTN